MNDTCDYCHADLPDSHYLRPVGMDTLTEGGDPMPVQQHRGARPMHRTASGAWVCPICDRNLPRKGGEVTNIADELKAIAARSIPALKLLGECVRHTQALAYMRDLRWVANLAVANPACTKEKP